MAGFLVAGALSVLTLTACADGGARDPSVSAETSVPETIPHGAVKVGDDLYMVPLDAQVDGCPAFRQWSPTDMVVQAVYYRGRAGGFVLDRAEAVCP
jgi:uncharacterized protein (DUF779 family)